MHIDKEKVKQKFADYVKAYNIEDPKVKLKVRHTYRVAELCKTIANSISLSEKEQDLAWLLGMLHDIGRFEQLRIFNTFMDNQSVNHAWLGCDLLFGTNHTEVWKIQSELNVDRLNNNSSMFNYERGMIRDFIVSDEEDVLIYQAIYNHNAFRIDESLDERTKIFAHILRDADKIDILRVNVETPLEDIYNCSTEELKNCIITDVVLESFYNKQTVLRNLKMAPVDNVVGHISLVYELVYPISSKLVIEQGYLEQLMNFQSNLPETNEQFEKIRQFMNNYLEKKN